MMLINLCHKCRYFVPVDTEAVVTPEINGTCHRYPPRILATLSAYEDKYIDEGEMSGWWPGVVGYQGCGEFLLRS